MEILGIYHIAIIGAHYERSKAFYVGVLGFELMSEVYRAERESWMGKVALGVKLVVELFSFRAPPARASMPEGVGLRHLAFEVEDVGASLLELYEV